jgi:hypothetical protein
MPATELAFCPDVNVSIATGMAGFQLSINGRFWVSTEAQATGTPFRYGLTLFEPPSALLTAPVEQDREELRRHVDASALVGLRRRQRPPRDCTVAGERTHSLRFCRGPSGKSVVAFP